MKFFEALEILEKDLKAHLGIVLPNKVGASCQFVVIMQEFIENVQNTTHNSECTVAQSEIASPKLPSVGDIMKFNPSLNYDDVHETLHAVYRLGNFA